MTRPSPVYEPTPEEIRRACARIQAEWDERTERQRRTGSRVKRDTLRALIPLAKVRDLDSEINRNLF